MITTSLIDKNVRFVQFRFYQMIQLLPPDESRCPGESASEGCEAY